MSRFKQLIGFWTSGAFGYRQHQAHDPRSPSRVTSSRQAERLTSKAISRCIASDTHFIAYTVEGAPFVPTDHNASPW